MINIHDDINEVVAARRPSIGSNTRARRSIGCGIELLWNVFTDPYSMEDFESYFYDGCGNVLFDTGEVSDKFDMSKNPFHIKLKLNFEH